MKSLVSFAALGAFAALACQSTPARAPSAKTNSTSGLAVVTILARGME